MHNESSQIDELFRKASHKAEQEPMEGDWDALKGKLFKGKPVINKIILWSAAIVVVSGIMVGAALYFNDNDTQKALVSSNRNKINNNTSRIIQNEQIQSQEAPAFNAAQSMPQTLNYTTPISNFSEKSQIQNPSDPALPYKVQVGAFKNKPSNNFYSNLGNLTVEDKEGYYKYYAGEYDNPSDAEKKLNELKSLGFNDAFIAKNERQIKTVEVPADKTKQDIAQTTQQDLIELQPSVIPVITSQTNAGENQNNESESNQEDSLSVKDDTTPSSQLTASNGVRDLSNKNEKEPLLNRFGVGAIFSYDIDKYHLIENNDYGSAIIQSSSGLLSGSNDFSYTIGLLGTYRFSKKVSVESGVLYSQMRKLEVNNIDYNGLKYSFDYNGKYLDIPIRTRYYFINNPVHLFATAGMVFSPNFPVKNKGYFRLESLVDTGYYEVVTLQSSSIGIAMQIGCGVEYMLQKKLRLYVMPIYNYSFSAVLKHPTYNNEPVKHFIRSFNISAGVYFDF